MKKIRIQKWKQLEIIRCLLQVCALIKGITHAKADAKELLLPGSPLRLNRRTSRSTTVTSLIVTHCSKVTILFSDLRTYWFKEKKWKKNQTAYLPYIGFFGYITKDSIILSLTSTCTIIPETWLTLFFKHQAAQLSLHHSPLILSTQWWTICTKWAEDFKHE